jgi:hypothetical protein
VNVLFATSQSQMQLYYQLDTSFVTNAYINR